MPVVPGFHRLPNKKSRLPGTGVRVRTLTAALSVYTSDEDVQHMDPNGASRNVTIDASCNYSGAQFWFYNSADADGENLVIKDSAATTIGTVGRGETGWFIYDGVNLAWKLMLVTDGTSDLFAGNNTWTGTQDISKTVTVGDELVNADLTINHATGVGIAVDAQVIQATTARTGGSVAVFRGKATSLAGDLNSVKYSDFLAAAPTDGGGSVIHQAFEIGAGHDVAIDSSAAATGETDWVVGDNLASALEIRENTNRYLQIVTTNTLETMHLGDGTTMLVPVLPAKSRAAMADADAILSDAQHRGGIVSMTPTATRTLTTRTAAQLVAAFPGARVGSSYLLEVCNLAAAQDIAVAGGTGVTLVGNGTISSAQKAGAFRMVFTNVTAGSEAVDLVRVG